ncbi:MAG: LytTR family DNA-binding domain-containing protein [Bacteroidota bacterium]
MRAIIVEDEPSGMENLLYKLDKYCPEIEVVGTCASGAEAIREIKIQLPDVLFLDIQLGDMTGFDVLKAIRHPSFELIFTTSYDEYAIEAIKNSALDYLLKPIEVDELMDAVGKAKQKIGSATTTSAPAANNSSPAKMGFPVNTGQQFIELSKVLFAKADDNVALLYLNDDSVVRITKSLSWVESELSSKGFCRIHHSYLINFNQMQEYIRNDGGYVVMSNQKAISISRRRKEDFLLALESWNNR